MSDIKQRLIDGDKLLNDLFNHTKDEKWSKDVRVGFNIVISMINWGIYNLHPQGEAERLRETIKNIKVKLWDFDSHPIVRQADLNALCDEALSSHTDGMTTWTHDCREVNDLYGFQVVAKGKPCPFCDKTEASQ